MLDDDDKSLKEFGVKQGDQLEIKDLGPQIGKPSCSRVQLWIELIVISQSLQLGKLSYVFFAHFGYQTHFF